MYNNPKRSCHIVEAILLCATFLLLPLTLALAQEIPITTSSKEARQLFIQGRDNLANVQFREAAKYFDQAIQKDPEFALAYLYRAQSGGGYNLAMSYVKKAAALVDKVSPGEKLLILTNQAGFEGDRISEKSYAEQLDKAYPNDKWAQTQIGEFHYGNGDYKVALKHFSHALKLDANFAPPYNMIGYANSQLSDYSAAENAFKKYISLIPGDPNPYDSYAELLQKIGKYDESTAQYEKALSIDPQFISSMKGIGDNYLFKGDYSKAREYYDQEFQTATAINNKLGALFWKAVSYVHENKIPEALEGIQKERELADSHDLQISVLGTHNTAAFILCETGKPDEGMREISDATLLISRMPVSGSMKENLSASMMLSKCFALVHAGKISEATNEAAKTEAIVRKRQDLSQIKRVNFIHGIIELKKNNNEKALSYFADADNESPLTWYYTAVAYQNNGNKSKSAELFKKISTWNVNSLDLALVRNRAIEDLKASGLSSSD
ncbi:MAG TPA: tetratricopeptide repeat protein [Balneolales bacterium]|nr:tetratricopeptide repeat protein [Balneolales bacterium]